MAVTGLYAYSTLQSGSRFTPTMWRIFFQVTVTESTQMLRKCTFSTFKDFSSTNLFAFKTTQETV